MVTLVQGQVSSRGLGEPKGWGRGDEGGGKTGSLGHDVAQQLQVRLHSLLCSKVGGLGDWC